MACDLEQLRHKTSHTHAQTPATMRSSIHNDRPVKVLSPGTLLPQVRVLDQERLGWTLLDEFYTIDDPYFAVDTDIVPAVAAVKGVVMLAKPHEGMLPSEHDPLCDKDKGRITVVCLSRSWRVTTVTMATKYSFSHKRWNVSVADDLKALARGVYPDETYPGYLLEDSGKVFVNVVKFADHELLLALPTDTVAPYLLKDMDPPLKADSQGVINLVRLQIRGSDRWGQTAASFTKLKYRELFGIDMRIPVSHATSPPPPPVGSKKKKVKRTVSMEVLNAKMTIVGLLDGVFVETNVGHGVATEFVETLKFNVHDISKDRLTAIFVDVVGAKENKDTLEAVMRNVIEELST